jgi:hypothetical protein
MDAIPPLRRALARLPIPRPEIGPVPAVRNSPDDSRFVEYIYCVFSFLAHVHKAAERTSEAGTNFTDSAHAERHRVDRRRAKLLEFEIFMSGSEVGC